MRVSEYTDPFERLAQDGRPGSPRRDIPSFFDAGYCAKIARVLTTGFRQLAGAPEGPQNVGLSGCGTSDAKLWWTLPDDPRITGVVIYRRRADGVQWQQARVFPKSESQVLPGDRHRQRRLRRGDAGRAEQRIPAGLPRSIEYWGRAFSQAATGPRSARGTSSP